MLTYRVRGQSSRNCDAFSNCGAARRGDILAASSAPGSAPDAKTKTATGYRRFCRCDKKPVGKDKAKWETALF